MDNSSTTRTDSQADLTAASELQDEMQSSSFDENMTASRVNYEIESEKLCNSRFKLEILERLLSMGRITTSEKLQFELGFQEALANSVEHGNLELESSWKDEMMDGGIDRYEIIKDQRLALSEYAKRKIFITVEHDQVKLTVTIKDQGKGFDVVRKQKTLKGQVECHGRGLFIIDETMDQVKFDKNGTEVMLVKMLVKSR